MHSDSLRRRLHGVAAFNEQRVRFESVVLATLGLAILTNGPSIELSHHYSVPLGWERWPYLVPMGLVAYTGVFLAGRSLRVADLRQARLPLILLFLYLSWAVASVLWSVAPDATAIRSLVTAGISLFGIWFGLSLSFREQLASVSAAMSALCFWSLALIYLQPDTHQIYPPPWHPGWHTTVFGVFGNPNSLGPVAALGVLSAIGVWFTFRTAAVRAYAVASAVVGVILVIWSQCITAIASLFLALVVICAAPTLRWIRKVKWWIVSGSLALGTLVIWNAIFGHIGRLAPLIGESTTLSSRRLIWADARSAIALRPWRGYGFFAFWDNEQLTAATYQRIGSPYGSTHNSVLEVALGLGRVGLVVYVGMALCMVVGVARALWRTTSVPTVAWAAFALFLVVQNSMESFVLWHSYLWVLFVAATIIFARLVPSPALPVDEPVDDVDWLDIPEDLRGPTVAHVDS
jgi:exopolysaccharide production protein ExoQ